jgi:ubiquinone/menaquinone biosynthesis C-methylase UbiE
MGLYASYIFPAFFDTVVRHKGFDRRRTEVLNQVQGKILEIGIGTGLNLDFYPDRINEIWAIDPNPGMERELSAKLKNREMRAHSTEVSAREMQVHSIKFKNREVKAQLKKGMKVHSTKLRTRELKVHFSLASAESLPFETASFQSVVSTLTSCSIPDLQKAFSEIRRVLVPGGRFVFLEHGLSHDPPVARLQKFLNPVQNIIGCGCKLTVDVGLELKKADFKILSLKTYYVPRAPKFLGHVYEGTALHL